MVEIEKILNKTPKNEIISTMIAYLSDSVAEHKKIHLHSFSREITLFDRIITQYYFLSLVIKQSKSTKLNKGRALLCKQYLRTIANNFLIIKELFISGLHIQFQLIIRTQLEYIDNLIAFTGDDEFFKRFCTENDSKHLSFITPKPIHSEKSLKKLMKEHNKNEFDEIWKIFKEIKDYMYKDLSESSHGNIMRIFLQTFGEDADDKEILTSNLAGVKRPLPVTINLLRQCLNYFQITYSLIFIQLTNKNLLDYKSPFIGFTKYYLTKEEFITNE